MKVFRPTLVATVLCAVCAAATAAGSVVITPATVSVAPAASFAVQVGGASFTDNVIGGGFSLAFDPALLRLDNVSIDPVVWEFATSAGTIDNTLGTLTDTFFNTNRPVLPTGDFDIATLTFTSLGPAGTGALTLLASASFPFVNDLVQVISIGWGTASVTVVPEPGTWALLAAGLALLAMRRPARCSTGG